MPELDLPDLSLEVAERAQPPRFEAVLARARRQRRRRYAAVGVAAAVVLGAGVGVAGLFDSPSAPSPAAPTPSSSESDAQEAARLIADPLAAPVSTSVSANGDIAVLWKSPSFVGSAFALRVGDGPDTIGMVPGGGSDLVAVPDGWLVAETPGGEQQVLLLAPDGTVSGVEPSGQVADPGVGDRVLVIGGQVLVYSFEERRLLRTPPMLGDVGLAVDAGVTGPGRVVASCFGRSAGDESAGRCVLSDGTWTYTAQVAGKSAFPAMIGTSGDHAAVPTMRGNNARVMAALTLLDGDRATAADVSALDVDVVSSVTVLDDGFTVIGDREGRLTGVTPGGQVSPLSAERSFVVTSSGIRLWAASRSIRGPLRYSDDHGESWRDIVMPGLAG